MLAALVFLALAPSANAERVLVVENRLSPASVEIAEDYLAKRHVKNLLKVDCQDSAASADSETMSFENYQKLIDKPLRAYLAKNAKIDFIVLTKGVPIRLTGAPTGVNNERPSLDSTIAAIGYSERKDVVPVSINDTGFKGKAWVNRFWNSKERFSHAKFGGYLVTRLDAYSVDEAKALTSFSLQSEASAPTGKFLIDIAAGHGMGDPTKVPQSPMQNDKGGMLIVNEMAYNDWDADLAVAADRLQKKGVAVRVDKTDEFIGHVGGLMGYASWGSNDPKFVAENYKTLRFAPGGIAETAVSTSARTFLPTTGGQSLIADLIVGRVTGVKGYCDEPLLQAVASPTILFDRYTSGWTLAESFYAASRFVGWEDIVVGDPLCAPYARR